jgi:hypothetical protein
VPGVLIALMFIRSTGLRCDESGACELTRARVFGLFARSCAYDVRTQSLQYSGRKKAQLTVTERSGVVIFTANPSADDAELMMQRVNAYQQASAYQPFEIKRASYMLSAGFLAIVLFAAAYAFNRRWLVSIFPAEQLLVIRRNRFLFAGKETVPFSQLAKVESQDANLGSGNIMRKVTARLLDGRFLPMSDFVKIPIGIQQNLAFEALTQWQQQVTSALEDAGHRAQLATAQSRE